MTKNFLKNKENRLWIVLTALFMIVAALLRFMMLDNKPIHFDESINMWFVKRIWEEGFFTYDPTNYHGPLYFYLIHFAQLFTGFDVLSTRWVSSVFSFLTVAVLWFGPETERRPLRWAALFLLMSPAMGFYGRSGIHESAFVFFQVLSFLSFHYFFAKDFKKFWWYFGAGLLGMMALKETFVILILAWIPSVVLCWILARGRYPLRKVFQDLRSSFQQEPVYVPLLLMFLVFVGIYSGFGGNPKGIKDFFWALMPWLKTGVHGAGHEKEFLHWSRLMWQNEPAILCGFFVGLAFVLRSRWILFYATLSFGVWLIYSLIPYKTPWCLISLLWPFAIVAGFGMDSIFQRLKMPQLKWGAAALLTGLFVFEAKQLYILQFRNPIEMSHPFVYVNSTYQMKEFIAKVQGLLVQTPLLREAVVQIGSEESWPFPIVFSKFYNLNYQKYHVEVADGALIYLVDPKDQQTFEKLLTPRKAEYQNFFLETRQGRGKTLVYVKKDLFQNVFSWPLSDVGTL